MSKKNKKKLTFRRHKIKYEEKNPVEELMDLYKEDLPEEEADVKTETNYDKDHFLKEIIENKRTKRKKRIFVITFLIIFLLFTASAIGFLFFSNNQTYTNQNLTFNIETPDKVIIGEPFEYTLNYQNLDTVPLLSSFVNIQLPNGFILDKSEPEILNHKIAIGNLNPGDKGEIKINGKIIDNIEEEQNLLAIFYFQPENFNSEFSKQLNYSFVLEKPNLQLISSYPSNVVLGQKFEIKIKLKNETETLFENNKLILNYPENFQFQSAMPSAFEENNIWLIPEINPMTESKEIIIAGFFPSNSTLESKEQPFKIELNLLGKDQQYFQILEQEIKLTITDQALNTYLIVNGSTENKNIELGQTITFTVISKNNGEQAFENSSIKAHINSSPLDIFNWNKIQDKNFGKIEKTETGKTITWTKNQISDLKSFENNEEITLTFTLPIKTLAELNSANDSALKNLNLDCFSEIVLLDLAQNQTASVKSSPVSLQLNTNINVNPKALYYYIDGTPIGSGPLPFKVNETTKLQIFWELTNDLHEIENASISATLPDNARWTRDTQVTAGTISYDENSGKVTWTINRLPEAVKRSTANFGIEITPTNNQAGQIIKLLGNTTLSATDLQTKDLIIKTTNILTSALEQDEFAETDGLVQ